MKKIYLPIILIMLLCCACARSSTENKVNEAISEMESKTSNEDEGLSGILNDKSTFIWTETNEEIYLSQFDSDNYMISAENGEYKYVNDKSDSVDISAVRYCYFDLDQDGNEELLIELNNSNILVLHEDEEKIYGYSFPYRGMLNIRTDGTYGVSGGAAVYAVGKVSFDKEKCYFNEICMSDELIEGEEVFRLNGKESNKKDVKRFLNEWEEKNKVEWIEIESDAKVMSSGKHYKVYDITKNDEPKYIYEIYNESGEVVKKEEVERTCPNLKYLSDTLISIEIGAGTELCLTQYYDTKADELSEIFETSFAVYNNKVVYMKDSETLIVRDIFDESKYIKEFHLDFSPSAVPAALIKEVNFINDNELEITYLSGEDYNETTEILLLDEVESDFLLDTNNSDIVYIRGKELLDNKETQKTVEVAPNVEATINIKRDHPNGMQAMIYLDKYGYNLMHYYEDVVDFDYEITDEFGFALPDYYYEIACYDFNEDGEKELIFAAGNKKDALLIYVLKMDYKMVKSSEEDGNKNNYDKMSPELIANFKGTTSAYINENNEICIVNNEENRVDVYNYNGTKIK